MKTRHPSIDIAHQTGMLRSTASRHGCYYAQMSISDVAAVAVAASDGDDEAKPLLGVRFRITRHTT